MHRAKSKKLLHWNEKTAHCEMRGSALLHVSQVLGMILVISLAGCAADPCSPLEEITGGCATNSTGRDENLSNFSGNWSGQAVETTSGNTGALSLTIEQDGAELSGVWSVIYTSGTSNGGSLTGTVSNEAASASMLLEPSVAGTCALDVTVVIEGNEALGNYATADCPYLLTGTVHVFRQSLSVSRAIFSVRRRV